MTKKERYKKVIDWFEKNMSIVSTELNYNTDFQLLVAVILSAQCTDKRVNLITPELFKSFPNAEKMSHANVEEIYNLIKSCTYPNAKAKHISEMAKIVHEKYNGKISSDTEELQKLPGVGRKTANVIAVVLFRQAKMPVDTHVFRVSKRIGLADKKSTILQTELELEKNIPPEIIPDAHHWLILHGRYVCVARNPKCAECGIKEFCRYVETIM
ncbi:MAG: endonuclease III [Bacteroidales bacterium]|jgi:endonuclease-3|nr:endonuclease III [Bacteroidales bacterium]